MSPKGRGAVLRCRSINPNSRPQQVGENLGRQGSRRVLANGTPQPQCLDQWLAALASWRRQLKRPKFLRSTQTRKTREGGARNQADIRFPSCHHRLGPRRLNSDQVRVDVCGGFDPNQHGPQFGHRGFDFDQPDPGAAARDCRGMRALCRDPGRGAHHGRCRRKYASGIVLGLCRGLTLSEASALAWQSARRHCWAAAPSSAGAAALSDRTRLANVRGTLGSDQFVEAPPLSSSPRGGQIPPPGRLSRKTPVSPPGFLSNLWSAVCDLAL